MEKRMPSDVLAETILKEIEINETTGRKYPPAPFLIGSPVRKYFLIVVPLSIWLLFSCSLGWVMTIFTYLIVIPGAILKTKRDWEYLCDQGLTKCEVPNEYLTRYGFVCYPIGTPVRSMTKEEFLADYNAYVTQTRTAWWRNDNRDHAIDAEHFHYSETEHVWYSQEEWEDVKERVLSEEKAARQKNYDEIVAECQKIPFNSNWKDILARTESNFGRIGKVGCDDFCSDFWNSLVVSIKPEIMKRLMDDPDCLDKYQGEVWYRKAKEEVNEDAKYMPSFLAQVVMK